ncbi:dicarboxylate/amino acid:cation symporter [Rickettsiales bacterium]|nr:dicarboxylate/amino acid:cation symporter [Rickettsiales bacterium]
MKHLKKLWVQVIIGLVLGVTAGIVFKEEAESLKILGKIFIKLIKMVIVPLIFFALLSGITSIAEGQDFKSLGIKGFASYMFTAMFAVIIGLVTGVIFKPGEGVDLSALSSGATPTATTPPSAMEFLLNLIPSNPVEAMASGNFLQLIVFTIFTGVTINLIGDKARAAKQVIDSSAQIMFQMIGAIVKLAPYGVFGFIASVVGTQGIEVLESLGKLIVAVMAACVFQYIIFGVMLLFIGRVNPIPFYKKMVFTQSLAFATSSSKATLSTAMEQLQSRLGVSRTSTNFLLPLGACINMDGTAIYLGIVAVFFAQAFGVTLETHDYLMLVLTCTLGSIGAAGIPSGSIIFMGMVLTSVGLPLEGIALILGIDRILDMVRTTINITGDSTITLMVDSTEGTLDEKLYYSKDV